MTGDSEESQPMDFDEWREAWLAKAVEQGHVLQTNRERNPDFYSEDDEYADQVDEFAGASEGYHNGPLCTRCGWAVCMHCNAVIADIPPCDGVTNALANPGLVAFIATANPQAVLSLLDRVEALEGALAKAFRAGFAVSGEGWNGEHPSSPDQDVWLDERAAAYAAALKDTPNAR